jgi:hypothetical protein
VFEEHRPIFSFLIAAGIQRDAGAFSAAEWDALLRGGGGGGGDGSGGSARGPRAAGGHAAAAQRGSSAASCSDPAGQQPAKPGWLADDAWAQLCALDVAVPAFAGVAAALVAAAAEPRAPPALAAVMVGMAPYEAAGSPDLAALWQRRDELPDLAARQRPGQRLQPPGLSPFQRLLLVRALREEALPAALAAFVEAELGPGFTPGRAAVVTAGAPDAAAGGAATAAAGPNEVVAMALADSCATTPIVLMTERGADPLAPLLRVAAAHGRALGCGLQAVSLGQGQGPVAEGLVALAMRSGGWVVLQVGAAGEGRKGRAGWRSMPARARLLGPDCPWRLGCCCRCLMICCRRPLHLARRTATSRTPGCRAWSSW